MPLVMGLGAADALALGAAALLLAAELAAELAREAGDEAEEAAEATAELMTAAAELDA